MRSHYSISADLNGEVTVSDHDEMHMILLPLHHHENLFRRGTAILIDQYTTVMVKDLLGEW